MPHSYTARLLNSSFSCRLVVIDPVTLISNGPGEMEDSHQHILADDVVISKSICPYPDPLPSRRHTFLGPSVCCSISNHRTTIVLGDSVSTDSLDALTLCSRSRPSSRGVLLIIVIVFESEDLLNELENFAC